MNESSETSVPRKPYRNWATLVFLLLVAGAFQLIPEQPFHTRGPGMAVKAKTDIAAIMQSLSEYAVDNEGSYPRSLAALVEPDNHGHCYLEGYGGVVPQDPWKREYHYEAPMAYPRPHVWTYGADGKPGGTGDNSDIYSEQLLEESR